MASITNPRKNFQYSVSFPGHPINQMLFQEFDTPDMDFEVKEHGDSNYLVKTAGQVKFGTVKLKKLLTTGIGDSDNNFFFNWGLMCQDAMTGGGLPPSVYWRTCIVHELTEDGTGIANTWEITDCWPSKINGMKLDRIKGENSLEDVELQVNMVDKL